MTCVMCRCGRASVRCGGESTRGAGMKGAGTVRRGRVVHSAWLSAHTVHSHNILFLFLFVLLFGFLLHFHSFLSNFKLNTCWQLEFKFESILPTSIFACMCNCTIYIAYIFISKDLN